MGKTFQLGSSIAPAKFIIQSPGKPSLRRHARSFVHRFEWSNRFTASGNAVSRPNCLSIVKIMFRSTNNPSSRRVGWLFSLLYETPEPRGSTFSTSTGAPSPIRPAAIMCGRFMHTDIPIIIGSGPAVHNSCSVVSTLAS